MTLYLPRKETRISTQANCQPQQQQRQCSFEAAVVDPQQHDDAVKTGV